jgi:hypothetical protein
VIEANNSSDKRRMRHAEYQASNADLEVRDMGAGHSGSSPLRSKHPMNRIDNHRNSEEEATSGIDFS